MNSAEFISGARKIVQDNLLNQQFGVLALAHELGVSRSELYRRIKSTENKSASQFIREIRLEKAAELVKSRKYSIAEIAYMVGFNSPTYFSTCYKEYFGFSPSVRGENVFKTTARSSRESKKWVIPFVLGAISLLIFIGILSVNERHEIELEKSLAVLKFDYLGTDPKDSFLAIGLADEIINSLSNIDSLKVITGSSSFQIDKKEDFKKTGKNLGVNYLVDGSISYRKNQLRVTVKLVEVETGYQLWAKSYEEQFETFFEIQKEISERVADQLKVSFLPEEKFTLIGRRTTSIEAFELYLKAKKLGEERYEEAVTKAINWLEQAVKLDPSFAEAYAELSFLYGQWHYYGSLSREERDKMMGIFIKKALDLNPESPDVKLAKADYDFKNRNILNDSSEIISAFRAVLKMKPNSDRCSYRLYQVLRSIGKYDAAHEYLENTVRMDPLNSFYKIVLARDLFWKKNEREKGFRIIVEEGLKDNPKRGTVHFKALMLADQPSSDYLSAIKVINKALGEQPYTYGYLYWGTLLALDLNLVPLAKKYAQLIQIKYPDNPIYTYEPAFKLCIIESRYEDALDLTKIWLENKGLDEKIAFANLAKIYFLQGKFQQSEEILIQNFSHVFERIDNGQLTIDGIQLTDIAPIKSYIEVLREKGETNKAAFYSSFLCSYYNKHVQRVIWGEKMYAMDCYYLQDDINGFLSALNETFFITGNRLSIFSNLKSSRYAAFEDKADYQELFKQIDFETRLMSTEVITFLKEQGDWDTAWDEAIDN